MGPSLPLSLSQPLPRMSRSQCKIHGAGAGAKSALENAVSKRQAPRTPHVPWLRWNNAYLRSTLLILFSGLAIPRYFSCRPRSNIWSREKYSIADSVTKRERKKKRVGSAKARAKKGKEESECNCECLLVPLTDGKGESMICMGLPRWQRRADDMHGSAKMAKESR